MEKMNVYLLRKRLEVIGIIIIFVMLVIILIRLIGNCLFKRSRVSKGVIIIVKVVERVVMIIFSGVRVGFVRNVV